MQILGTLLPQLSSQGFARICQKRNGRKMNFSFPVTSGISGQRYLYGKAGKKSSKQPESLQFQLLNGRRAKEGSPYLLK